MSGPDRMTRRKLLYLLLPASGACFSKALPDEALDPRLDGGQIRVSAPQLRFVSGSALERLQNGALVPFALQLALSTDRWASVSHRDIERFVFSYDLWEQRFSIAKLGNPRRSVDRLSARDAESWCIREMVLPQADLAPEQHFWLRLEARAENPAEDPHVMTEEGVSLTRLVELFSRRSRGGDGRWSIDAGPFRLASLARPGVVR
jgi:hypothetical protein